MGSDSTCLEAADTKAVDSADSACYNFPEEGKETVMKKKTEEKKSIVNEAGNDIKANQFAEFAKRFWDAHPELKKDLGR
jgi:phosphoribosyl-ATP pyrophosphohydrolase